MLEDDLLLLVRELILSSDSISTLLAVFSGVLSEAELDGDVGEEAPDELPEPSFFRNFDRWISLGAGGANIVSLLVKEWPER